MPSFRTELDRLLRRADMSALRYAKALGHTGNGAVSAVLKGERPVPLDSLDTWLDALPGITPPERERLFYQALQDYGAAPVQALVREVHELRRELSELRQLVEERLGPPPAAT